MKPSLAKGTRDFTAQEVYRRKYIINTLQKNFELFGFQPLETPSFENLSTLTGKYGEEGDRLIFKILNSGDFIDTYRKNFTKETSKLFKEFINSDIEKTIEKENFYFRLFNKFVHYFNFKVGSLQYNLIQKALYDVIDNNFDKLEELGLQEFLNFIAYSIQSNRNNFAPEKISDISEKALRYDLTVPFARFVAMNQGTLTFPFKRYKIQKFLQT
jgi:histidyl-tRNA synthetase